MRYIINDDDLEDWYSRLYQINKVLRSSEIEYVLGEIEKEIKALPREDFDKFLKLLKRETVFGPDISGDAEGLWVE